MRAIASSVDVRSRAASTRSRCNVSLYCGRYEEALRHVRADTLICDPPFSKRTHKGQLTSRRDGSSGLAANGFSYAPWSIEQVRSFVFDWTHRVRCWFCVFCSHDLVDAYSTALSQSGRYVFAPIACVQTGQNVRLQGDGPSNWTTYLVVARPRAMKWRALPGAYIGTPYDGTNSVCLAGVVPREQPRSARAARGSKPLWLMRAIVEDYSRRGELIVDPCAGRGTTLVAAQLSGRHAVGAERDAATHDKALQYINACSVDVLSHKEQL